MSGTTYTRESILEFVSTGLVSLGADAGQIVPAADLDSLGLDSLDIVDLLQSIRRHFGIEVRPADFVNVPNTVEAHIDVICDKGGIQ